MPFTLQHQLPPHLAVRTSRTAANIHYHRVNCCVHRHCTYRYSLSIGTHFLQPHILAFSKSTRCMAVSCMQRKLLLTTRMLLLLSLPTTTVSLRLSPSSPLLHLTKARVAWPLHVATYAFVKYKNAVAAVASNHHCLPPSITAVALLAPAAIVHYLRSPRFAFAFTHPPRPFSTSDLICTTAATLIWPHSSRAGVGIVWWRCTKVHTVHMKNTNDKQCYGRSIRFSNNIGYIRIE